MSKPHLFEDHLLQLKRSLLENDPLSNLKRASSALAESLKIPNTLTEEYQRTFALRNLWMVGVESKLQELDSVSQIFMRESEKHEKLMRTLTGGVDSSRYRGLVGLEESASTWRNQFQNNLGELVTGDVERLKNSFNWIDQAASNYRSIFGSLDSLLEKQHDEIHRLFSTYADISIEITNDEIEIGGESVSAEQVREALETLCAPGDGASADENFARRFVSLPSILQWFVLCVLVPYIVSIVANLHTPYYERIFTDKTLPGPGAKADIRTAGRNVFLGDDARYFRFVVASQLNVRETCRSKAKLADTLNFGKTVKLIRREKDWSVVEYLDDDSAQVLQGCVYSRYLAKFE